MTPLCLANVVIYNNLNYCLQLMQWVSVIFLRLSDLIVKLATHLIKLTMLTIYGAIPLLPRLHDMVLMHVHLHSVMFKYAHNFAFITLHVEILNAIFQNLPVFFPSGK